MKIANIMEYINFFTFFFKSNNKWNYSGQKNANLHFLLLFLEHFDYVAFFFSCIDFTNYMISSFWHFQFEGSKKITPILFLVGRYWCWWYFLPEVKACFSYFFKAKIFSKIRIFFPSWFELLLLLHRHFYFYFLLQTLTSSSGNWCMNLLPKISKILPTFYLFKKN